MAVTLVEFVKTIDSGNPALVSTPAVGDVAVVVVCSINQHTATAVSGLGGTWTSIHSFTTAGGSGSFHQKNISYWRCDNPTTAGTVTVTVVGGGAQGGRFLYLVRGLTSGTTVAASVESFTAGPRPGPSQMAKVGSFVIDHAQMTDVGGFVIPDVLIPSTGWTHLYLGLSEGWDQLWHTYRIPTESTDTAHQTSPQQTNNDNDLTSQMVLWSLAPPPPPPPTGPPPVDTGPYSPDTPTLLADGPLTHAATAQVTTPDGDTIALPIIDGTVTYDETRSPRVEATLTTHLAADAALATRIDPRVACRLKVAAGYIRPGGVVDVQLVADLGLRTRTRARPDDTLTLTGRSDEALLIDSAPSATLTVSAATTAAAITGVITGAVPGATVNVDAQDLGPAVSFAENNVDKWGAVADFADRIAGVVYDDGLRTWHIAYRPNYTTTPTHYISDGPAGTLVQIEETYDRDGDWANRVQLVYEWQDTAGVDKRIVATADATGPYAPTAGNTKTLLDVRDTPTLQAFANLAATNLVARTNTRARTYTLTAPSAYWVRPGQTINVTEANTGTIALLVVAVTFDLRTGLMSIDGRLPELFDVWDQQPASLTWDAVGATMTWDTYITGG